VFDAVYMNAVLQHVADASAVVCEARRVMRPGAAIGVADTDWGTRIMHPYDPLLDRGQQIQEQARPTGNIRVGRELRGLLVGAGFERIELATEGRIVGSAAAISQMAAFERGWFDAPEVIAYVTELGTSGSGEMAEIASAWTRWSASPAACAVDQWFTALAWSPVR
jgi:SAM-dependent methyltransferase